MANKTGRAVLWFAPCTARGDTSDFALGLKCFSDTSVDILFTFVNALKMPPPQSIGGYNFVIDLKLRFSLRSI
jgi:hypothetical protein